MTTPEISQRDVQCINCRIPIRKISGRKRTINSEVAVQKFQKLVNQDVVIGSRICSKCWLQLMTKERKINALDSSNVDHTDVESDAECVDDRQYISEE